MKSKFFEKEWKTTEVDSYVVDIVKKARCVIDVGCGYNVYKEYNDNLLGVDTVNDAADLKGDIYHYKTDERYDVAICYGVLHFNSYDWIRERLEWVVDHTTPDAQILIKVNPSRREDQAEPLRNSDVIWFNRWNHGLAQHFAEIYNLEIWNWREWRNPHDNSLRLKFDYRKVGHGII